jgi:SAM-dependent methyltransferase
MLSLREVAYDGSFFREEWFQGWAELRHVLEQLVREGGRWHRILDFGCGPGVMIDHMNERGFKYVGCDYSESAQRLYLNRFGAYPQCYVPQLKAVNMADFDVLISFDVFEHMTDDQIAYVLEASKPIPELFLNISRDLRTPGHINIRSDRAWMAFFKQHGLQLREELTARLRQRYMELRPGCQDRWDRNMFVFSRGRV